MNSNNFMYRTMFLLSDSLHPGSPQHAQAIATPVKKLQGNFTSVCEKDCQCVGSHTMFCANQNGFISPPTETRRVIPKFMPYSSLQLSLPNSFPVKKDDLVVGHPLHSVLSVSDQQDPESIGTLHDPLEIRPLTIKVVKERPYSCEDCGKTFLLKHHLVTHARVHSGERPHVCVHCGKSFTHKHCLSTHLLLHSADRPYTCQECNKSFTLKHHLVTHARVHNRERPYVCQECGRSFPQKRHLVTHAKFHSGERPYVCSECGESFAQEDHLVLHSRFHGEQRPYHCQDCGLSFARKFELVNHSRSHGKNPYSCSACGKEFLQKRSWQQHLRLHTSADAVEHPFCCIHCGEAFQVKDDLAAHTCGDKEKNFICRECGNGFSSREGLSLHLRIHAGDRSFVPDLCSLAAAFQQQQSGTKPTAGTTAQKGPPRNENNQQESTDVPRQSDQQLGSSSVVPNGPRAQTTPVARKKTSPKTLKTFPSSLKPKPHVCPDCGRGFAQKHGLLQHSKRYTNGGCELRQFACEKCGKAFYQKNHLVLHERQHLPPEVRYGVVKSQAQSQQSALAPGQSPPLSPEEDPLAF